MKILVSWVYHWSEFTSLKKKLLNECTSLGHSIDELYCRGSSQFCYSQEASSRPKLLTCLICNTRRIMSSSSKITKYRIDRQKHPVNDQIDNLFQFALSSVNTLTASEDPRDLKNPLLPVSLINNITTALSNTYAACIDYFSHNNPDVAIILNGRMEHLRLITNFCINHNIPYFSVERSILSYGLYFNPMGNCLSTTFPSLVIKSRLEIQLPTSRYEYTKSLLIPYEGALPGELINFKKSSTSSGGNTNHSYSLVFLLSSESEIFQDDESQWSSFSEALSEFSTFFDKDQIVVKGHPLWSVDKANVTKSSSSQYFSLSTSNDDYYSNLCQKNGVTYIHSSDARSSLELASQAAVVVLQNSSIYYEVSMINPSIVCLRKTPYCNNQNVLKIFSSSDLLDSLNQLRKLVNRDVHLCSLEESIDLAIHSFHAVAFDLPLLHDNICSQTTSLVRKSSIVALSEYLELTPSLVNLYQQLSQV